MYRRLTVLVLLCVTVSAFKAGHKPVPYVFPELKFFPAMPAAVDNPVTKEGVLLGRHLFYDPILSKDSSFSCASCHKQANAFSDAPNAFSRGFNNAMQPRNTPPLYNLAWYGSLFWDGRAASIEEQVFHPVRTKDEMGLDWVAVAARVNRSPFYRAKFALAFPGQQIDSLLIAKAIAQFERTLISYRSKYDSALHTEAFFTPDEAKGFELVNDMTKGDCLHCHTTDADPLGTTLGFSNNGLDAATSAELYRDKGRGSITGNAYENGQFKIPSLRNLAYTAPYMHDGRFKTLEEVLDFYSEGVKAGINTDSKMGFAHAGGAHLSADEKKKILAFLMTLNDPAFVTDTSLSNPWRR